MAALEIGVDSRMYILEYVHPSTRLTIRRKTKKSPNNPDFPQPVEICHRKMNLDE
jgi:hypothetical protein